MHRGLCHGWPVQCGVFLPQVPAGEGGQTCCSICLRQAAQGLQQRGPQERGTTAQEGDPAEPKEDNE